MTPQSDPSRLPCSIRPPCWLPPTGSSSGSSTALTKFLYRTDLGLVVWYGTDRTEQFGEYFDRLMIPSRHVDFVLYFAGVWELAIAIPFIAAAALMVALGRSARTERMVAWGLVLSAFTFIAFSALDVVAGDRAELREHGLYLALVFLCCVVAGTFRLSRDPDPPQY